MRRTKRRVTSNRDQPSRRSPIVGRERADEHSTVFTNVPQHVVLPRPTERVNALTVLQPRLVVKPTRNKLLMFRESQRWTGGAQTRVATRAMPFITREGYISSNAVYYWRCSSAQWIASVSATVYQRLLGRWKRLSIDGDKVMANRDLLCRIAVIYTLTLDSNLLTRSVECAKRNEGAARKLVYKWSRMVDAQTRFWYDQLNSTGVNSWLQLRGRRPRAKSTNLLEDYRIIGIPDKSIVSSAQRWADSHTHPWVRMGVNPSLGHSKLIILR